MAEKTLNDPLSGAEIKQIILQEVEKRLNGDCTLNNDLAYAGFTSKFEIKISYLRSLTPPTLVWGVRGERPSEGVETEEAGMATIDDSYTSPPPNIARTDHSLPIPVMVQTPTGPVRTRVQMEGKRGPGRPPKVQPS